MTHTKWLIAAIKNQATGHYILNGKGEEVKSKSFIELGAEWHYIIEDDVETLHTDGPLHDPVVVLVRRALSSKLSRIEVKTVSSLMNRWTAFFCKQVNNPSAFPKPHPAQCFYITTELNLIIWQRAWFIYIYNIFIP